MDFKTRFGHMSSDQNRGERQFAPERCVRTHGENLRASLISSSVRGCKTTFVYHVLVCDHRKPKPAFPMCRLITAEPETRGLLSTGGRVWICGHAVRKPLGIK